MSGECQISNTVATPTPQLELLLLGLLEEADSLIYVKRRIQSRADNLYGNAGISPQKDESEQISVALVDKLFGALDIIRTVRRQIEDEEIRLAQAI